MCVCDYFGLCFVPICFTHEFRFVLTELFMSQMFIRKNMIERLDGVHESLAVDLIVGLFSFRGCQELLLLSIVCSFWFREVAMATLVTLRNRRFLAFLGNL